MAQISSNVSSDGRRHCECGRGLESDFTFCPGCGRPSDPEVLCQTLRRLARKTFQELAEGFRLDLPPGEESLTDGHLLEMQRAHERQVRIKRFSKADEAANGADWEWWFHKSGRGFGMRVQAKRQNRRYQYPELGRNAGSSGRRQVDRLIEDAANTGTLPYYVLYNHRNFLLPGALPMECDHAEADQCHLGCTITSALTVRAALDTGQPHKTTFESSEPWHLPFCGASDPRADLTRSFTSIQRLHDSGLARYLAQSAASDEERSAAHPLSAPLAVVQRPITSAEPMSDREHSDRATVRRRQRRRTTLSAQVMSQLNEASERGLALELPDRALQLIHTERPEVPGPDPRAAGAVVIDFGQSVNPVHTAR